MNGKIFISYSWIEPSGSIVNNWLKPALKKQGINYMIDRDDCKYNSNIDLYEKDIVNAEKIILVLSPSFFYSVESMYEAALAVSKCDNEKQIYVINTFDYNFRNDQDQLFIKVNNFFLEKEAMIKDELRKLPSTARGPKNDDLHKVNTVLSNLTALWRMLKSKNSGRFIDISKNMFENVCYELKSSISVPKEIL